MTAIDLIRPACSLRFPAHRTDLIVYFCRQVFFSICLTLGRHLVFILLVLFLAVSAAEPILVTDCMVCSPTYYTMSFMCFHFIAFISYTLQIYEDEDTQERVMRL